ncbi:MAG: DUF928 domain-containing protein [Sulfuricellaceae bacterium]|nr:DUF928 domain-containing protein [Sulfuricellaceae bacterium]
MKFAIQSVLMLLFVWTSFGAYAAENIVSPAGVPMYKPPLRGAPASRVGGGSRGMADNLPKIAVLAPDHTGYTTQEQPVLYWYLSKPVAIRLEITITDDKTIQPLLEKRLEVPAKAGIQALSLKDHGIHLKPGAEYSWFVGLVADAKQRSSDVIAGGTIARKEPAAALQAKLAKSSPKQVPFVYAEEGFWYDAIASISSLIAAHPEDQALRQQRAALLEQVGLSDFGKD